MMVPRTMKGSLLRLSVQRDTSRLLPSMFAVDDVASRVYPTRRSYNAEAPVPDIPKYAVVHHVDAYAKAMNGLHGHQLALAQAEGEGKDDPDFDPFLEEELEEARLIAEELEARDKENEAKKIDGGNNEDEEGYEMDDQDSENDASKAAAMDLDRYNRDGSLKRNKSELAILRAGAPSGGLIAVIQLAGTQFKVTTDDVLIVNRLVPVEKWSVGSVHTLTNEDVLLVGSTGCTAVGMPWVEGAEVDVMVEEITRDKKVIIFKKRRRKSSQRKTGFRRDVTMLRILDIRFPQSCENHDYVPRPEPAPLVEHVSLRAPFQKGVY